MDDKMDEKQIQKHHLMTQTPVGRLICRLALPCIVSMLVTSFYNMADTFFVGMLKSNSATGAVGVVFSFMALIQAVGFFFGHGSGNFISRELGRQDVEEASRMAATGFFFALAAGVFICVLGLVFLEPLSMILGSTATILPHTKAYLRVILLGAPWMTASLVLNNQLRYQGSAAYAMVGIASGAVLNIALDPVLIFGMKMGIAGAAWATIISQFVGFCLLLTGCCRGGLPSLARQGLASVATICLNRAAGPYGDAAIAAMGVVQRIAMFGGSAMIGFGQGFQPVCGFNFGAGLYGRVKEGFWFCVRVSLGFLLTISVLGWVLAPNLIAVFRDDPDVIACGTTALRFQCLTFASLSWTIMSNMMLQTIGRTAGATFLAMARQGIFFIPLVGLLSNSFGLLGIQITQTVSDALTLACALPIQLHVLRQMTESEVRN